MSTSFPPGAGNGGSTPSVTHLTVTEAVQLNAPEEVSGPKFNDVQPTDPGGTNTSGWLKTKEYFTGEDSGRWKQT